MTTVTEIGSLISRRPEIRGGRPCIAGAGVSVRRSRRYNMGLIPQEIAHKFAARSPSTERRFLYQRSEGPIHSMRRTWLIWPSSGSPVSNVAPSVCERTAAKASA